jgi:hypothetical protein
MPGHLGGKFWAIQLNHQVHITLRPRGQKPGLVTPIWSLNEPNDIFYISVHKALNGKLAEGVWWARATRHVSSALNFSFGLQSK